mgnify:CR=1 FL=1
MTNALSIATWLNGHFLAPQAPAVRAEDPGFLLGLAVFETFLCEAGKVYYVDEHLARLAGAAQALGIDFDQDAGRIPEVARQGLAEVANEVGVGNAALRLTLTPGAPGAGAQVLITTSSWTPPASKGVLVAISKATKVPGLGLENVKTTGRARNVLAREEAQGRGAYEALLCTEDGDLSEGTVSNIFLVLDGILCTPPLARGCLPGIMRSKVLLLANELGMPVQERRIEASELEGASGAFLTNSLVRILPILGVVGLPVEFPPGGEAWTRRLTGALKEREAAS